MFLDSSYLSLFRPTSLVATKWRQDVLSVTSERRGCIIFLQLQSSGQTQGMPHELKEPGSLCRGHEKDQCWVWMAIILPWASKVLRCLWEFTWDFHLTTRQNNKWRSYYIFLHGLTVGMTPVWTHQNITSQHCLDTLAETFLPKTGLSQKPFS